MTEQTQSSEESLVNPVSQADFDAVTRLFDLDPQFATEADIAAQVAVLRANRGKWLKAPPKKSKAAGKLSSEATKNVLASLNLTF